MHWVNESLPHGETYDETERREEVRCLIYGGQPSVGLGGVDSDDDDDDRIADGICGAAERGEASRVGRCAAALRSYFDLKYCVEPKERADWARELKKAAQLTSRLPLEEKLWDAARRCLHCPFFDQLRPHYNADAAEIAAIIETEASTQKINFASGDRVSSRRRALTSFLEEERKFASAETAKQVWDRLKPTILANGAASNHEANLALGVLRGSTPSTADFFFDNPTMVREWKAAWLQWNASGCASEADAAWLTLLCRARKYGKLLEHGEDEDFVDRLFSESYRRFSVPVGGARAADNVSFRAWPSRYRWLSLSGGDAPSDRCSRKLAKLIIHVASVPRLGRLVRLSRPYFHPSNGGGAWTPRLGLCLSELCRELARQVGHKRIFLARGDVVLVDPKKKHQGAHLDRVCDAAMPIACLLAPLARDALYARHSAMVAAGIWALRDLCGTSPRLVAEVCVPAVRSALEESAVNWAHQAPAALRACAALARPLFFRRAQFTASPDSDDFLQDPDRARRAAFFDGQFPTQHQTSTTSSEEEDPPLARLGVVGAMMQAAVNAVDANDDAKTRCALLFFDSVLRWIPVRCDDETEDDVVVVDESTLGLLSRDLGEHWAPVFLERLLQTVEHRDDAARVPNHGPGGSISRGEAQAAETLRYAHALASAREAASAEMVRSVARRFFRRLRPESRRRAAAMVRDWIRDVTPRSASAKDAASIVAACVAGDVLDNSGAAKNVVDSLFDDVLVVVEGGYKVRRLATADRLAFTLRLLAGACRASTPDAVVSFIPRLVPLLRACLTRDDKPTRKNARKLLRDALRGLLETRSVLTSEKRRAKGTWPDDGVELDPSATALSAIAWITPSAVHVETAADLAAEFIYAPLLHVDDRLELLNALRQCAHGVKGACSVLTDTAGDDDLGFSKAFNAALKKRQLLETDDGARATLGSVLARTLEKITLSPVLCRDAKIARAALKATRATLVLRRSAHAGRARAALSAIRARRRALGADAAARCAAEFLDGKTEDRGLDDFVERAQCHHWARCLDRGHRDVRALPRDSKAAKLYDHLIGLCLGLTKHDYADVRGAALETIDACWPLFGWVLKPRLQETITGEFRGNFQSSESEKRSSGVVGAAAFVASRSAMRKLTADQSLGSELLCAAVDFHAAVLTGLRKDDRDDAADRLDGVVALYASRRCRKPKDAAALAVAAAKRATEPGLHWRRRFLAAFVALHALSGASESTDLWGSFVIPNAVIPDDDPIARLALCAFCKRVSEDAARQTLNDDDDEAMVVVSKEEDEATQLRSLVVESFVTSDSSEKNLKGLLGALRREHRRERARESEDGMAPTSPIVETLLREAKHSEPWAVFPKTMAPYSSRGFRSRNARFIKRLVRLMGDGTAQKVVEAGEACAEEAPASERGAACATAAEVWAGALRSRLRSAEKWTDTEATFFFDVLKRSLRSSSPDHALCWADAVRYATGAKAARDLIDSGLLAKLEEEWLNQLTNLNVLRDTTPPSADSAVITNAMKPKNGGHTETNGGSPPATTTWALAAKWLALVPSVAHELAPAADPRFLASARRLAEVLLASPDHLFAAVRERVGLCLAALAGGAVPLGAVVTLDDVDDLARRCRETAAEEKQIRKRRETLLTWMRHAGRDGVLTVVARLLGCALDGVADSDDDHRTAAAHAVAAVMHVSRSPQDSGVDQIIASLLHQASHPKWRARCAVAAYLGAVASRHAFVLEKRDNVGDALRRLASDPSSEVRDAASASLASLIASAPRVELDPMTDLCLADATALLPTRQPTDDDVARRRIGAVQALGACVLAFPYDVPPHVPKALVILARHSNLANKKKSATRYQAAIRDAVKSVCSEFKRTHAETWAFIRDFFDPDQHDALADVLTSDSYFC